MRYGVIVFPGTNCDLDTLYVLRNRLGQPTDLIWHETTDLSPYDCVVLPGGFSYGDYLRSGAIARFAPVMRSVEQFAVDGGLVLGICNGFQVLVEARLLPGAMQQNRDLRFICRWTHVRVESEDATPFTRGLDPGRVLRMPIAHHEGSYFVDSATLAEMSRQGQVVLRYCEPSGVFSEDANPNGSVSAIAGVCNQAGNVFGLMPHPERASDGLLGGTDGLLLLAAAERWWAERQIDQQGPQAASASSKQMQFSTVPSAGI